jgi:hypothetical protein
VPASWPPFYDQVLVAYRPVFNEALEDLAAPSGPSRSSTELRGRAREERAHGRCCSVASGPWSQL